MKWLTDSGLKVNEEKNWTSSQSMLHQPLWNFSFFIECGSDYFLGVKFKTLLTLHVKLGLFHKELI